MYILATTNQLVLSSRLSIMQSFTRIHLQIFLDTSILSTSALRNKQIDRVVIKSYLWRNALVNNNNSNNDNNDSNSDVGRVCARWFIVWRCRMSVTSSITAAGTRAPAVTRILPSRGPDWSCHVWSRVACTSLIQRLTRAHLASTRSAFIAALHFNLNINLNLNFFGNVKGTWDINAAV